MSVQIRTGGTWRTAASGALYVRYSGSWRAANACYVKIGAVGGGYWHDSGYRGYPAVPSTPWVTGWDYSNVNVGWSAGGGGAPVSYYQLEHNRPGVQGIDNYGGGQSNNYGVAWDTQYSFRVRAVSTGGLVSAWSPYRYVAIGHPQQDTYGYVQRSRGWDSGHFSGGAARDQVMQCYVPVGVQINAIHWRDMYVGNGVQISPGTNRYVQWVTASADTGREISNDVGVLPSHNNMDFAQNPGIFGFQGAWGNNDYWGIICRGGGWTTAAIGNPQFMLWCVDLWFDGTEYYNNWELISTIPEQGNSQWT